MDDDCKICSQNNNQAELASRLIWQNDEWLLLHHREPYPLNGWLLLQPKRHIQGVAYFNDREASDYGFITKAVSKTLQDVLHVPKVYLIAFGESIAHMHLHFIPRFEQMASQYLGFGIADLYRSVSDRSEESANANDVDNTILELRKRFEKTPPINN